MKLEEDTIQALGLMPSHPGESPDTSLYSHLNRCSTLGGKQLLIEWIKEPSSDLKTINHRYDLVDVFIRNWNLRESLRSKAGLRTLNALKLIAYKIEFKNLAMADIASLHKICDEHLPNILERLMDVAEVHHKNILSDTYVIPLKQGLEELARFKLMAESLVDLDVKGNGVPKIDPCLNQALQFYHGRIEEIENRMDAEISRISRSLGVMRRVGEISAEGGLPPILGVIIDQSTGWTLQLPSKMLSEIQKNKGCQILSKVSESQVTFTTQSLRGLSSFWCSHVEDYALEQEKAAEHIIRATATFEKDIQYLVHFISHLDVIISLAEVSVSATIPYVRPKKLHPPGTGNTVLRKARHPCLEQYFQNYMDDAERTVVANDVSLVRGESELIIITGPNMGGKTTYLRMIGIISIMAHIGCYLPCQEAEISMFDNIFAQFSTSNHPKARPSTLMAEVQHCQHIRKNASTKSLILIDGLGRGTGTFNGDGVAWAQCLEFLELHAFIVFATHIHECTSLADDNAQVKNYHFGAPIKEKENAGRPESSGPLADVEFTYELKVGPLNRSVALELAQIAGIL